MAIFDPKVIPVLRTDAHLPSVPGHRLQPQALRERFREDAARAGALDVANWQAAVLIPLVMRDELTVLLTQRPAHMRTHAGQIAFPGGRMDDTDVDAVATALREAQEEVGLPPTHVEVLGTLPKLPMRASFGVTPVVALVQPGFELRPNALEVAEVFEVPLQFLMNPANHQCHRGEVEGRQRDWYSMPYRDGVHERYIWGATAQMLRELYRCLMP